jgi:hypothetical protein
VDTCHNRKQELRHAVTLNGMATPPKRRRGQRPAKQHLDINKLTRTTVSIYQRNKHLHGTMKIIYAKNVHVTDKESKQNYPD